MGELHNAWCSVLPPIGAIRCPDPRVEMTDTNRIQMTEQNRVSVQ